MYNPKGMTLNSDSPFGLQTAVFSPVFHLHFHLPIPTQQVKGAEDVRYSKCVQGLINTGNGICILPSQTVHLGIINTEAH